MILFRRPLETLQRTHTGKPFEIVFWNGERWRFGAAEGAPEFSLHFKTRRALIRSFVQNTLGLGESYVAGDVVVEGSLEDALTVLFRHGMRHPPRSSLQDWAGVAISRSLSQEKADIEFHYGRGDAFYSFYLDKKLQYSCGYFRTPEDSLDQAQDQKIAHTAKKLDLRKGQRLLDIGCGWGHLMFHAAEKYGVSCLGITLCDSQAKYISEQARQRKLPIDVRTMSYLELDELHKWDRIVTVGMMCHVGHNRADAFYDKLASLSAPGAVVLTHCISKMKESKGSDPFVSKHVFPGYWFFSLEGQTKRAVDRGFNVIDVENLRRHYALTAHHWRKNFLSNYGAIKKKLGFDDRFMRTWDFYLASVVAGFRAGHLNLIQTTMSYGINDSYPLTREFLYDRSRSSPIVGMLPSLPLQSHLRRSSDGAS
ncbi:MAG TPA: cyclopropane-fatty-acyl-phospholipid synthase family protein [Labilithrix sp.]|nr:cyclopropane-fatty-acyl-phospholipid synthase family protein [Labilithrix sp.]